MDKSQESKPRKSLKRQADCLVRLKEHLERAEAQRERTEALATARAIALAGLPKRRTDSKFLARTLRLGEDLWLRVEYSTSAMGALPYGQDRFVLAGIQHLAVQRDSPVVYFEQVSELLKMFELSTDGRSLHRLRERFGRLSNLSIRLRFAGTEQKLNDAPSGENIFIIKRFSLPTRQELRDELRTISLRRHQLPLPGLAEGEPPSRYGVLLTADFWQELKEPKNRLLVPLDLMRKFVTQPTGWDYAAFLVYRCTRAKSASVVPHEVLMSLFKDGEKEFDKTTINRLLRYHQQIMDGTNGHLKAELRPAGHSRTGKRGRPKEQWALHVWPSDPVVYSGKKVEQLTVPPTES